MEVVDGWLAKLYPRTPTWREIADVVEHIGHSSLADSIRQVYVTGETRRNFCAYLRTYQIMYTCLKTSSLVVLCGKHKDSANILL